MGKKRRLIKKSNKFSSKFSSHPMFKKLYTEEQTIVEVVKENKQVKPVVDNLKTEAKPSTTLQAKETIAEVKKTNIETKPTPQIKNTDVKVVKSKSTKIKTTKPKNTATAKTTKTKTKTKRTSSYRTKKTKQANDQVI